ncbi:hypothetical protein ACJX0J_011234, partial [Zea mays]
MDIMQEAAPDTGIQESLNYNAHHLNPIFFNLGLVPIYRKFVLSQTRSTLHLHTRSISTRLINIMTDP